jgi:hypothetical protein
MIVELVRQGRRVGITAVSHKVISKLLGEACSAATDAGVSLKAVQRGGHLVADMWWHYFVHLHHKSRVATALWGVV